MSFNRANLFLLLLLPALSGCGPGSSSPDSGARVPTEWAGFVLDSGTADLRGSPKAPLENSAVWVPQPVAAIEGWGKIPKGWRPAGERATLAYRSPAGRGSTLELALLHRQDAPVASHSIEVQFNGRPVGGIQTASGLNRSQVFLPPGLLQDLNEVELHFDPSVEEIPGELQTHLSLIGFGVTRTGMSDAPVKGLTSEQLDAEGALEITQAGVFIVPWKIPAEAGNLNLDIEGLGRDASTLRAFALRSSGERVDLAALEVDSGDRVRESMAVSQLQGEQVYLCLEVVPSERGGGISIGGLWVDAEERVATAAAAARESAERPDVVLIVLDAARGDRFPGWSYPRQVMPNLTELGQDSMVFRYAFAECPTTSCSIPALLTGLSFLSGGEVGRGKQLSDQVTTLAEYLGLLGYHTVGFSATPNNSASRNLHQGFDEFRELWGRGNPDHGPFNMSRLASDMIRQQPRDEPLFLQLHYLPPHQPYAPSEEFDHWSDPDYSGPIRPEMSLGPVNEGRVSLLKQDLEQLVGLYDGNLLLADSAVGQVLATLRSTGRFDNSLIIITSDHGEAFMEHGMVGHNTTLFDEMLHVPLMIRLPGGAIPEGFDHNRLASTLDVVPTVLGYLGAVPDGNLGGVDLVRTVPDPEGSRILFLRTSHPKNAMVAARTAKWKQISWPRFQVQMLFDLEADSGETDNLVSAHPDLYAGMGLRIRRHLVEASQRELDAEAIEVTPEAEEALRALGYLD